MKPAISRIENHAEDIKLSTLEKVAAALGKRLQVKTAYRGSIGGIRGDSSPPFGTGGKTKWNITTRRFLFYYWIIYGWFM